MMLARTSESICQLRLPASIDPSSRFHLIVQIRDAFDCVTEFNLSSVPVLSNHSIIENFVNNLQGSNNNTDPIITLLTSEDQNTVEQMITSISQVFNEMNDQSVTSNC